MACFRRSSRAIASACAADHKIDKKQALDAVLYAPGHAHSMARSHAQSIENLANVRLELHREAAPKLEGAVRSTPEFDLVLKIPAAADQSERLEKENEHSKS